MFLKNCFLLNVFLIANCNALNEETYLRNDLMESYNKYVRPVAAFADSFAELVASAERRLLPKMMAWMETAVFCPWVSAILLR